MRNCERCMEHGQRYEAVGEMNERALCVWCMAIEIEDAVLGGPRATTVRMMRALGERLIANADGADVQAARLSSMAITVAPDMPAMARVLAGLDALVEETEARHG